MGSANETDIQFEVNIAVIVSDAFLSFLRFSKCTVECFYMVVRL